ncbi:hypothetical protein TURU_077962 [Turdus rufiventris]|nr:hypothetical protein TURU_077962 [Turdus rufiventris]
METLDDCQERARHDDITLGATGGEPGSGSIGAPNSIPASNVSSSTAVTTAQKNAKDIQEENTNYSAAFAMLVVAPTPSMFKSEVTSSFDPAVFWKKGDPDLTSPRKLNPEAKAALEIVEQAITNKFTGYVQRNRNTKLLIF